MSVTPDYSAFEQAYKAGETQLVGRRLVNDLETPVSAYLKLAGNKKNAFLLESVEGGENLGRFSIIGMKPDLIWRCFGERSEINEDAAADVTAFKPQTGAPLENLKRLLAESELTPPPDAATSSDWSPPLFVLKQDNAANARGMHLVTSIYM